jgi:8-oxo-dGTP diphosphatase
LSVDDEPRLLTVSAVQAEIPENLVRFVVALARYRGRWVLVRVHGHRGREFPGGKVDPGEDPLTAVRRELSEETGVNQAEVEPAGWYAVLRGTRVSYGYLYRVECLEEPGNLPPDSEIAEVSLVHRLPREENRFPFVIPHLFTFAESMPDPMQAVGSPSAPRRSFLVRDGGIDPMSDKVISREAVRAVVFRGDKLLMIHSPVPGDLKFPGGGVEAGEDARGALARELLEETGFALGEVRRELMVVTELRKPREAHLDLYRMDSRYFLCGLDAAAQVSQKLDDYERELGMVPRWIDPAEALTANRRIAERLSDPPAWLEREILVLEQILGLG